MKRTTVIVIWMCLVAFTSCTSQQTASDTKILFDFDWKFALNEQPGAEQPGFDDSNWRVLDVPHDFSIEQPFDSAFATGPGGAYTFGGIGWYRKHFTTDPGFVDKKLSVLFDGAYRNSEVWINGHHLGIRPYGYSSFYYDITSYLNPVGQNNVMAVKVNTSEQDNSRWYTGAGIYRHVWLISKEKLHINQWGVFARTVEANEQEANINVSIEVNNELETDQQCTVLTKLLDSNGKVVAKAETRLEAKTNQQQLVEQSILLKKPSLWSVEQPNLYTLQVEVISNKQLVDAYSTAFGVRTFQFDPNKGFILNGKQVKLKGVNNHHDGGPLGAAVFNHTHKRQLSILKEMGCNALRMSHNPPAPELLAYADSMGFVVIDEIFDEWMDGKTPHGYAPHFEEWYQRDVENWIRRDRNHPSVIAWSIGNEVKEQWDEVNGPRIAKMMIEASRKHDTTRPFTAGSNGIPSVNASGLGAMLDLVGYNYHEALYADDHKKYPNQVIYGSETVMYPYHDYNCWQMRTYEEWLATQTEDYIAGEFLWTGFDYLGEAGIGDVGHGCDFWKTWPNWPWRGADCGVIDMCGHPKPGYWFRKALWTDEPIIYLAVQTDPSARNRNVSSFWNWPKVEAHWNHATIGDTLAVHVYTNVPDVELRLNGKSLGTRNWDLKNEAFLFWEVPYEPGKLEAIGKTADGKTVSFAVQTAGEVAKIVLTPDCKTIKANKQDLSYVTVQLLDTNDVPVPFANKLIEFEVSGAGKLLAVGNGNQQSHTFFKGGKMETHLGKCLAIVQSTDQKGEIILSAKSGMLPIAKTKLKAK
ncbi:glycoside hydrolase family 2 TIM barrel-domain containing protein [Roseimarinus sediminis]|uniref:glycoside hydrolase family 2 TIM barrel-domain containing protein n=1 Tax=Roseimarinus sediminis TaxID=1610899 RepID=UPI003D1BCA85